MTIRPGSPDRHHVNRQMIQTRRHRPNFFWQVGHPETTTPLPPWHGCNCVPCLVEGSGLDFIIFSCGSDGRVAAATLD
jgi:hypothetical protein